jgi:H+/Cl- antiporter ClcA
VLLGIAIAASATLSLGAVLGPEAPLIALGAGLAGWVIGLAGRERPPESTAVVAGARAST